MLVWVPARILTHALPAMVETFEANQPHSNSDYEEDTSPPAIDVVCYHCLVIFLLMLMFV